MLKVQCSTFPSDRFNSVEGEDVAGGLDLVGSRRGRVAQIVGDAGADVFIFAHLVEGEDFDLFDIAEATDKFGQALDVLRVIRQAGHEDKADPGFVAARSASSKSFSWSQSFCVRSVGPFRKA